MSKSKSYKKNKQNAPFFAFCICVCWGFFCKLMFNIENDDLETKEESYQKQHLSDVEMQKLRNIIKTKIAGELTISKKYNYFHV